MVLNDEKKKKPDDTVQQAQLTLRNQLRPGGYQSQWQTQLDDTMKRIMNREKFNYDLNGDALYQQYKDQYITGGKLAMMDTMGQASALTGGYGNSYAQGVGQQAYQGYLQGLNDKIPELYQLALDSYNREGDALMQQYGLLQDREAQDYGMFQDNMALVQPQVMEMLAAGVMPSDEMLAASGLSQEYLNMLIGNMGASGGEGPLADGVSKKWLETEQGQAWLEGSDGQWWLKSREGKNWAKKKGYGIGGGEVPMYGDVAEAAAQAWEAWAGADPSTRKEKVNEVLNAATDDGFSSDDAAIIRNLIETGKLGGAKG